MILIVDYGMGNLQSVQRKLDKLKADAIISSRPEDLKNADKIILPGVGHFGKAMDNLKKGNWIEPLNEAVLMQKKPVLGICLGMQLMTLGSEEGNEAGLGWFSCRTVKMQVTDSLHFKLPHTGWNTLLHDERDPSLAGVSNGSEVYFVHSFAVLEAPEENVLTRTDYETSFVSSLRKDHIIGMQFHPEKSHETGIRLLKNFILQVQGNTL